MDFMADTLFNGLKLRPLTIVDNFSRESRAIEAGYRFKYNSKIKDRTITGPTI